MNVWKLSGSGDGHPEKRKKKWMQNPFFFLLFFTYQYMYYRLLHMIHSNGCIPPWPFWQGKILGNLLTQLVKKGIRCTGLMISIINWLFFYVWPTTRHYFDWLILPAQSLQNPAHEPLHSTQLKVEFESSLTKLEMRSRLFPALTITPTKQAKT